jgi:hypothetical protein
MAASQLGYTPGSGANVATDLDGGAHHQKALIEHLQDGVPTPVTEDAPLPVADRHTGGLLLRILQMLMAPLGYDKSLGRQRGTVVVETGNLGTISTVTTVTTVTTLANIAAVGGYSAQMTVFDQNRSAWAQCVRARIT